MSYRRSLGAITSDQLAQANQKVTDLSARLARQNAVLRDAGTLGIDAGLLAELRSTHARLFAQLQALTDTIPSLSTPAFGEWVARATGLENAVRSFESDVAARMPGAEGKRMGIIVVSTIGALAVAGGIAALLWYRSER